MDKPSFGTTLDLDPAKPVDDLCEMAKRAYNSARRGKLAYQALVFVLVLVLAVAVVYAFVFFDDEDTTKGILALVTAVGSLLTTGVFGLLAKDAKEDETVMWDRVVKTCRPGAHPE